MELCIKMSVTPCAQGHIFVCRNFCMCVCVSGERYIYIISFLFLFLFIYKYVMCVWRATDRVECSEIHM